MVYYDPSHAYILPHLARCFENSYGYFQRSLGYVPGEEVTVLLQDFDDYGYAGTSTIPNNYITLGIEPFEYVYETCPTNERFNWVISHELFHVVASEKTSHIDRVFRSLFRGKVLAFGVVSAIPVAIICVIAAVVLPPWLAATATLMAIGTFLISTAVSCGVSARFAVRQPEDGKRAKSGGASVPGLMFGLVQPIIMGALFGPVWIPVLVAVLTGRPAMALVVSAAGIMYGWFVFRFAVKSAGKALVSREPEMIQTLELGRVS